MGHRNLIRQFLEENMENLLKSIKESLGVKAEKFSCVPLIVNKNQGAYSNTGGTKGGVNSDSNMFGFL